MLFAKDHPLLVPGIVLHISRFVSRKDSMSCTRVCKAWNDLFSSVVWHSIDFKSQKTFINVDPTAVRKHGHHIRVVKHVRKVSHLQALHNPSVCRLSTLSILLSSEVSFQAYCGDLLRRNATTITNLDIRAQDQSLTAFPFDTIFLPPGSQTASRISVLEIHALPMTRDGFSTLLKMCPVLKSLHIAKTILFFSPYSEHCQHAELVELKAPLEQIFEWNSTSSTDPSILVHFPQLRTLHTWFSEAPSSLPFGDMKTKFAQCCPLLKEVTLATNVVVTTSLLTQTFKSLSRITVKKISSSVVMAILAHQRTLQEITCFNRNKGYYEQDDILVLDDEDEPPLSGWELQLIPQTCSRLTKMMLPCYDMDMDEIEATPWACTELEALFIRIGGLHTDEKIDQVISLLKSYRSTRKHVENLVRAPLPPRAISNEVMKVVIPGDSIEERVARHLARFEKLQMVWLGNKIRDTKP
jgi:hypothetical protein